MDNDGILAYLREQLTGVESVFLYPVPQKKLTNIYNPLVGKLHVKVEE